MGTSYNTNVVSDGLIGYWDAANRRSYPGTGTTWTALVGVNNGTLENRDGAATTLPSFDSNWQGVIEFDGTDDQVNLGDDKFIPQGTLPVTVNYWVHPTDYPSGSGSSRYFGIRLKHGADPGELFMIWRPRGGTSALYWGFRNQASMRVANDTGYNIEDWFNQWVNITWIYFGGTYSTAGNYAVYFNGLPATHYSGGTIGAPTQQRNVISNAHDWYGHFEGYIANVAIWNRGLTAAEVKQNYEAVKPRFAPRITKSGMFANWDAGDPESYSGGTTWKDTANHYDGTLENDDDGSLTFDSANGGSLVFDGTDDYVGPIAIGDHSSTARSVIIWAAADSYAQSNNDEFSAFNSATDKFSASLGLSNHYGYFYFKSKMTHTSAYQWGIASTSLVAGSWHCWAVTINASDEIVAIYQDGESKTSAHNEGVHLKDDTYIGCRMDGSSVQNPWAGKIGTVRLYTKTLSAAEIMDNFQKTRGRFGV